MHLLQVGAGSGGVIVLDLLMREPQVDEITLIEPDLYESHNVHRHLFSDRDVGKRKIDLVAAWIHDFRPDITLNLFAEWMLGPDISTNYGPHLEACDYAICALDQEIGKYHFDAWMRQYRKPWSLGEVLSGGIGGWIHTFEPDQACYGCVASVLKRRISDGPPPANAYQDPAGIIPETHVPATKASISIIASLHAQMTLQRIKKLPANENNRHRLFSLEQIPDMGEMPYQMHELGIPKNPDCLLCSPLLHTSVQGSDLDVALDQAIQRLAQD